MPVDVAPEKIPVILLYNVDPDWTQAEKEEVINLSTQLGHALIEVGYPIVFVPVADDDIASHLHSFDPSEYIIFNWCESLPGLAAQRVAGGQTARDAGLYLYRRRFRGSGPVSG